MVKKILVSLWLAIVSAAALAQSAVPFNFENTSNALQINGQNVLRAAVANGSTCVGPYVPTLIGWNAGGSYPITSCSLTAVGAQAFAHDANTWSENAGIGAAAGLNITNGNYNFAGGNHSMSAEQSANNMVVLGNDSARNSYGSTDSTGIGMDAFRNGAAQYSVAVGAYAGQGNAAAITFGGTPTVGHVINVTFTPTGSGTGGTYSYTVKSGDTLWSIVAGVRAAIIANEPFAIDSLGNSNYVQAFTNGSGGVGPIVLALDYAGASSQPWTITTSVTGGSSETMSVAYAQATSRNVFSGWSAGQGAAFTNPYDDVGVGYTSSAYMIGAHGNTCLGSSTCANLRNAIEGVAVGHGADTGDGNNTIAIGSYAGQGLTPSATYNNIFLGVGSGGSSGCVTTGNGNAEYGADSCVPSPTASNQVSFHNTIFMLNAYHYGNGVSNGQVGINTQTPGAALDVKGPDTASGTLAFRVLNSSNTSLIQVSDSGVVQIGGTTVSPNLSGTSGSIGGSSLAAGACSTGTVSISGATTSMAVQATPATYPGAGFWWDGYVSSANTATVRVCAAVAGTPTASAYNVRVLQ